MKFNRTLSSYIASFYKPYCNFSTLLLLPLTQSDRIRVVNISTPTPSTTHSFCPDPPHGLMDNHIGVLEAIFSNKVNTFWDHIYKVTQATSSKCFNISA